MHLRHIGGLGNEKIIRIDTGVVFDKISEIGQMALCRENCETGCVCKTFDVVRRWKSRATRLVILYIFSARIYIDGCYPN